MKNAIRKILFLNLMLLVLPGLGHITGCSGGELTNTSGGALIEGVLEGPPAAEPGESGVDGAERPSRVITEYKPGCSPSPGVPLGEGISSLPYCHVIGSVKPGDIMRSPILQQIISSMNLDNEGLKKFDMLSVLMASVADISACVNFDLEGGGSESKSKPYKSFVIVASVIQGGDFKETAAALDADFGDFDVKSAFNGELKMVSDDIFMTATKDRIILGTQGLVKYVREGRPQGANSKLWGLSQAGSLRIVSQLSMDEIPEKVANSIKEKMSQFLEIVPSRAGVVFGMDVNSMCMEVIASKDDKEFFRNVTKFDPDFFFEIRYDQIPKLVDMIGSSDEGSEGHVGEEYVGETVDESACHDKYLEAIPCSTLETEYECNGSYYGPKGYDGPYNCHWYQEGDSDGCLVDETPCIMKNSKM